MVRAGLRRFLLLLLIFLGGVAAVSATVGALAGRSVPHAVAIGYYIAGSVSLIICFAFGSRGPMRAETTGDDVDDYRPGPLGILGGMPRGGRTGRRQRRKATPEERREARLASVGLFILGVFLVLLGAAIDPTRRLF